MKIVIIFGSLMLVSTFLDITEMTFMKEGLSQVLGNDIKRQFSWFLQVESHVLFVETLFAELEEFNFSGEILSHNSFG